MDRFLVGLFLFLVCSLKGGAQGVDFAYSHDAFSINVKENLSADLNPTSIEIGESFAIAWNGFGPDVKNKIIKQTKALIESGHRLKPNLEAYFGAIAFAVNDEGISNPLLVDYLNMTQQVLDNYSLKSELKYFIRMQSFFKHRSLYHTNYHDLSFTNESYRFAYVVQEEVVDEDGTEDEFVEGATTDDDDWDDDEWDEDEWDEDEWAEETEEDFTEEEIVEVVVATTEIIGPTIRFDRADLLLNLGYDSISIKNVEGSLLIIDDLFVGEHGRINWTTVGYKKEEVYADVKGFELDVTKNHFLLAGAKLKYKNIFEEPIPGTLEFKPEKTNAISAMHYPKFTSANSKVTVKGLTGKFSYYEGGFTLEGRSISSKSRDRGRSTFRIDDSGGRRLKIISDKLVFDDSIMTSELAQIIIYSKFDSIYHPAVRLRYNANTNIIIVQKDKGNFKNTPYVASANKMNFTADLLSWNLDQDKVHFSTLLARHELPLVFQSNEYYDNNIFSSVAGLYDFNPLKLVLYYADRQHTSKFLLGDLADDRKIDYGQLKGAIMGLYERGYVVYDRLSDLVTITEKGLHKGEAQKGKADFDSVLLLSIVSKGSNAVYDLNTQEIQINGVDKFYLAKVLDVSVEADNNQITILQNRDIKFNGRLAAGNFDYVGHDFIFRYDSFLVEMQHIDAIELYVLEETRNGTRRKKINNSLTGIPTGGLPEEGLRLWESEEKEEGADSTAFDQTEPAKLIDSPGPKMATLSGTSGVLFISKPNNKSGKKLLPNYPKFKGGGTGSVVYFDKPEILSGAYDKSLYFTLPPFDLDSLNDSDPSAIKFSGTFHSDNWFPDFGDKLHIMEDYSLGFDHGIPPEGYQLFGGNGRLYNRITLDKNGVVGHGKLEFLTTTMMSDGFVFYPDSVVANGVSFNMKKENFGGIVYPHIVAENFNMRWLPLKDSMYITSQGSPFKIYDGNASLSGSIIVTNKGVNGLGILSTYNSTTISKNYTFNADDYNARHAQFEIKSNNPDKPALSGDDVRISFNLESKQAEISPEVEGVAAIGFPFAQFKTSITNARWDLENQKVYMSKPEDVDIESSYFYTTREDLDSLRFSATNAEYDMQELKLKVSGIPFIRVADSEITPENGEVLILENARIGTLYNTTIRLDTLTGYHEIIDATVTIISRNEFEGEGTYRFINAVQDTFAIKLRNFHLETFEEGRRGQDISQHSVANGHITEEDNLLISPGMYYKGDVKLIAHKKALQLDGYVKLDLKSIEDYDTWIKYASAAEQQAVEFKFEESVTASGKLLSAGLHFDYRDLSLYSTFIYDKKDDQDEDFFKPSGLLSFKTEGNEYIIINQDKDLGLSYSGKVFAYNPDNRGIRFEGPIHFIDNSKTMAIVASGLGTGNMDTNELSFTSFLTMDYKIPSTIYSLMADDFASVIDEFSVPEAQGDRTELLYLLAEIIGNRSTKTYESRSAQGYVPLSTMSPNLVKPFVFSNIKFEWSNDQRAFHNDGLLGMSNILRTDLNANFEGFFEIRKTEGGEVINLFIKAAPESWYYFSYENNKLYIYSSNKELNEFVKEKTNIGKAKIDEFQFGPSDLDEILDFINTFRAIYFDIDEPYDLQGDVVMEDQKKKDEADDDDDGFE